MVAFENANVLVHSLPPVFWGYKHATSLQALNGSQGGRGGRKGDTHRRVLANPRGLGIVRRDFAWCVVRGSGLGTNDQCGFEAVEGAKHGSGVEGRRRDGVQSKGVRCKHKGGGGEVVVGRCSRKVGRGGAGRRIYHDKPVRQGEVKFAEMGCVKSHQNSTVDNRGVHRSCASVS